MQSLSWYLRRLKSMSPIEIAWRVKSLLRDQADIARIPLGLLPRLPDRADSSLNDFQAGFQCSPVTANSRAESRTPEEWQSRLLKKADAVLENRLSYFDLDAVDHGQPFNWHRDHSAGIEAPLRLSVLTDYRNFSTNGDCKLVWEPNRHHQLVVLGRAFVTTGDVKYAHKIAEILRSWIDANPFGYGMNWKSPLEHGVRIINWIWAIDLIRDSAAIDDALWFEVKQSVYSAMWDGQRKFSRGSSANNHLIGEAAGVFYGACYFKPFPHAERWARSSQEVLEREIQLQTYDDGGTREHAFGYQFFVIQFFTHCLLAGDASGHPFSESFRQRLRAMYLFLHEISSDTGQPPNMGDKDDGYVLDLGDLPDNAAALLAVGAGLFDEPRLRSTSASETLFWMNGKARQDTLEVQASRPSRSFVESGYHFLRSPRMSVFFDCAEHGYGPIAAHGHADCLSIGLNIDNQAVIVDAGTYDYFTHPEWRDYFRQTRAHNTAEVDELSQSEMLGPFMWGQRAQARLCQWTDDDDATVIVGEHDGYTKLPDPLIHRRSLSLDKKTNSLRISDQFDTQGEHKVRLHFHLDPACHATQVDANTVEISCGNSKVILRTNGGVMQCIKGSDESRLGWVSASYHRKQASICVRVEHAISGKTTIETSFDLAC